MGLRFAICYLLFGLLAVTGCSQPQPVKRPPVVEPTTVPETRVAPPAEETAKIVAPSGPTTFAPVKIGILPLTELANSPGAAQGTKLNAFVTLLDGFGCQMKAPGVVRFELYEYVPRSAQQKGQRLALWPDIDLTNPAENNKYWRDFLRAYEFELDTQATRDKSYTLEVTYLCPDGKRLSGEYTLKGNPYSPKRPSGPRKAAGEWSNFISSAFSLCISVTPGYTMGVGTSRRRCLSAQQKRM